MSLGQLVVLSVARLLMGLWLTEYWVEALLCLLLPPLSYEAPFVSKQRHGLPQLHSHIFSLYLSCCQSFMALSTEGPA